MDLKKHPSVAETIDWAKALVMLNADSLDQQTLENTLTVLLKHESDAQRARRALSGGGGTGGDSGRRSGGSGTSAFGNGGNRPNISPNPFSGLGGGGGSNRRRG